jgi:para-aminobenzoate synthetase component 1
VKRTTAVFAINSFHNFKQQMLHWANQFNICSFLDTHQYQDKYSSVNCILAAEAVKIFEPGLNSTEDLDLFFNQINDWWFGHIGYEFNNPNKSSSTFKSDEIAFGDMLFFQPQTLIELKETEVSISCLNKNPQFVFDEIIQQEIVGLSKQNQYPIVLQPKISKSDYLQTIKTLQQHIQRGDCYEINFCQEFFAKDAIINPIEVYHRLMEVSPNPFSCYYKLNKKYLLCASPERYLKKQGNTIISQPIKGTIKRNLQDSNIDYHNKLELQNSQKDKSENVMVVDLVRNDLSKICTEASVSVQELFGIYSFPQVHQMISTINGELKELIGLNEIIAATFPMGSMTGAPKKKVMELIAQYEQSNRGIYSGCVGYINPQKDFDFNVVIRSIMYNETNQYLSYQVGGGVTFYSDAEKEYEECLLKAEAMRKVLE